MADAMRTRRRADRRGAGAGRVRHARSPGAPERPLGRADERPRRRVRRVLDRSGHLGGAAHQHRRARLLRRRRPQGHGRSRRPARRVGPAPTQRDRAHPAARHGADDRIAPQLLRGHPGVRQADRRSGVRLGAWAGGASWPWPATSASPPTTSASACPRPSGASARTSARSCCRGSCPSASPTRCSTRANRCRRRTPLRWGLVQSVVPRADLDATGRGTRPLDRGQRPAHQPALQGDDHEGPRPPRRRCAAAQRRPQPLPVRGPQGGRRRLPRAAHPQLGGSMSRELIAALVCCARLERFHAWMRG